MVALADKKQRVYASRPDIGINEAPLKASVKVWEGALLTRTGGYLRPLTVADGASAYEGIALMDCDIGAADGDSIVRYARIIEEEIPYASLAGNSGNDTITLTNATAVYSADDSGAYTLASASAIKVAEIIGYDAINNTFRLRHVTSRIVG